MLWLETRPHLGRLTKDRHADADSTGATENDHGSIRRRRVTDGRSRKSAGAVNSEEPVGQRMATARHLFPPSFTRAVLVARSSQHGRCLRPAPELGGQTSRLHDIH